MKFKGVIFDLDGVLVHTDKFHFKAWKAVADELGIEFNEKINDRLRGVSRMESLDIILERADRAFSDEEKLAIAETKNNIYKKLLENMSSADVTAEVLDTLNALRKDGVKLAIGSSSKNAGFILERVGLKDYFDAVSDGNNITKSKPDSEVFIKAADYLGLNAVDCAVVEDAYAGIDAAKAGGFFAVAMGDAASYNKSDYVLKSFSDLCKL